MSRNRILAIIQAGGAGGRMDVLTRERAKPALPFAGVYQLVDFPLSNLAHSGISEVWLSLQYQGASIEEPVANGRPWNLDRNHGGLRLLMPEQGTGTDDEDGFAKGNADELFRIRDQIRTADPEVVVVLSADHVYRFDYTDAVETHRRHDAECTVVTTQVPIEEAGDHATVEADDTGVVTGFAYKPDEPSTTHRRDGDLRLRPAGARRGPRAAAPRAVGAAPRRATAVSATSGSTSCPGWSSAGTPSCTRCPATGATSGQPHLLPRRAPGRAHRRPGALRRPALADPDPPAAARPGPRPRRRRRRGQPGRRRAPGSPASVRRSVLGPGVVVEAGAVVRNSVLFADTVVERGAVVDWAIVDEGCVVEAGAVVGPAGRRRHRRPRPGHHRRPRQPGRRGPRRRVPGSSPAPPSRRRRRPRCTPSRWATSRLIASARSGSPPQSRSAGRR